MTVALAAIAVLAGVAGPALCTGDIHGQFDFWLGDWVVEQRVHQPGGSVETFPAATSVTRSADGCVITEHWRGTTRLFWYGMDRPEDLWGYSVRRVDPATGQWLISWIDAKSPRFGAPFVGAFKGGQGIFIQKTDGRRGRIRFTRKDDGTVRWDLSTALPGSNSWRLLWEMDMRRPAAASPR